jgi:beta-galactosidase
MFIIVNMSLADLTWFTDRAIFIGATYVTENLSIDVPPIGAKVTIYSPQGRKDILEPARNIATNLPSLSNWYWRDAASEAAPAYDDSQWTTSSQPESWRHYGFENGHGWYRARFTAPSAGSTSFKIANIKKWAKVFVNGIEVELNDNTGKFNAVEGENTLAILAWHDGLDTFSIGTPKPDPFAGIFGCVTKGDGEPLATSWRFRGGLGGMLETALIGRVTNWKSFMDGKWTGSASGKRPSFWMTTFKSPLQAGTFVTVGLNTKGLSSGSVWVNGHNIGRFSGDSLLYIPEGWLTEDNTMVIYDVSGNPPIDVHLQYIEARANYANQLR